MVIVDQKLLLGYTLKGIGHDVSNKKFFIRHIPLWPGTLQFHLLFYFLKTLKDIVVDIGRKEGTLTKTFFTIVRTLQHLKQSCCTVSLIIPLSPGLDLTILPTCQKNIYYRPKHSRGHTSNVYMIIQWRWSQDPIICFPQANSSS